MKKFILSTVLLFPLLAQACNGYVIGFKGLNDIFDQTAFDAYVQRFKYCGKTYSWHQQTAGLKFVENIRVPYQLYGYSKGSESVSYLLKHTKSKKPEYVITLGAYRTTDVNFDKYHVDYDNYFDNSGIGQKSPGIYINVPHIDIQKEVNKIKKY
jgi:hypothetical protein